MKYSMFVLAGTFLLALSTTVDADTTDRLFRKASRYFSPLPVSMPGAENDTPERIALGSKLYFETRLSVNDTQSCASCHRLDDGAAGVDNLPTSPGAKGELGTRNTPTVLNAGWHIAQFWDGRAEDLPDQAGQPILNPIEMGMPNEETVINKLSGIEEYVKEFKAAFPDDQNPLTFANLTEAIAAFERTLRTESRFDDFLRGEKQALSEQELKGLDAFIKVNCVRCHDGPLLGGSVFEKLGVYGKFPNQTDLGRYEVTKVEEDKMVFKVPSLRNVALTAPYFHDGSETELAKVVSVMGRIQLDRKLKEQQVADIVAFLSALSDKAREKVAVKQ